MSETSYPLCWPDKWPRAKWRTSSRFGRGGKGAPLSDARAFLQGELDRLGGRNPILSSNLKLRLDGLPAAGQIEPGDTGVALYFALKEKPVVLACDKWRRVADNIWAIAKHIEALRGQERWGVGSIEQAFRGYMALPERSEASSWWKVLGVALNATPEQIKEAYRRKSLECHPDRGGTDQAMAEMNLAYAEALKEAA